MVYFNMGHNDMDYEHKTNKELSQTFSSPMEDQLILNTLIWLGNKHQIRISEMKTVIITGANGNLGTAVTKEFLDKNYQVIAIVSNENEKSDIPVSSEPGYLCCRSDSTKMNPHDFVQKSAFRNMAI